MQASVLAQRRFCRSHDLPRFAPNDGWCYYCHNQIYAMAKHIDPYTGAVSYTGITTDEAESTLVTGCPHCHRSYVD